MISTIELDLAKEEIAKLVKPLGEALFKEQHDNWVNKVPQQWRWKGTNSFGQKYPWHPVSEAEEPVWSTKMEYRVKPDIYKSETKHVWTTDPFDINGPKKDQHDKIQDILESVKRELDTATKRHGPFNSSHEGYAVIKEELDELWEAVKRNSKNAANREAVQIAAMAVRFILDNHG